MGKSGSALDVILCQVLGVVLGGLTALPLFFVLPRALRTMEAVIVACTSLVMLPVLGFVLGTLWGLRSRKKLH